MELLEILAQKCEQLGGRALLVGGSVRDKLMGIESRDWDVEVYGISPEVLRGVVFFLGKVDEVGKAFAILRVNTPQGVIDISLPRRDSKTGKGHKDFAIATDPFMSVLEAARRRDFTINSLAQDILTGDVFDYFGGVHDIENKILRVTDPNHFSEDPLRIMRGLQFVSRFNLDVHPATKTLMAEMVQNQELFHLPKERLREEWLKLFNAPEPAKGLKFAHALGIFAQYPFIENMAQTPQDPIWHPEGDVWAHTMLTVESASKSRDLVVRIASFCHDFGKVATTTIVDGKVSSHGHDREGVIPAVRWLTDQGLADFSFQIAPLIREHLMPRMLFQRQNEISRGALVRLARRLSPATSLQLAEVARADYAGRGTNVTVDPAVDWFLDQINQQNLQVSLPPPIISGKDLVSLGLKPGPLFGQIIVEAEERHLNTGEDRAAILAHIAARYCI